MSGFRQPINFVRSVALTAALSVTLLLDGCQTAGPIQPPSAVMVAPVPVAPVLPPISTAEQTTLRNWVGLQDRLYHVAAPLLSNNTELCKGNARNLLGFSAKNRYSFSDDFADAAQQMFGLDERLQVMDVLPNSGAAKAGMRRGDILLSVEDKTLPSGVNATRQAAAILGPLVNGKGSVRLNILRGGRPMNVTVPLTNACAFGIELGNSDATAAYSDGRRVLVTRGMLKFARADEELAYVLAREMAHNILGHPQKQRTIVATDSMIDNLIRMHPEKGSLQGSGGIKPMPAELDAAADNLAVYLLARAGYGIDNAPAFWQKLAFEYPANIANGYTALHPSTAARLAALTKASAAVKQKQADKKPLLP
jgi:hypothetical protein